MRSYIEPVLIQAVLLMFQSAAYFGIQKFEGPAHDVARPVDKQIPLVPQMIFIYILWYPLIAVFPLILYHFTVAEYRVYIVSILFDIIISLIIYMVYPTSFQRPDLLKKSFAENVLRMIYKGNYKGKNCMPSMHCSMCFIIMIFTIFSDGVLLWLKIAILLLAMLIVFSAVLTKQHVLIDVITAFPIAIICCGMGYGVCKVGGFI